jgi:Zn finger protein HypA/HybF involved in hydrogenase expression
MKILPDGTIECEPDGTVSLSKGDRFPFRCPECSSLFPFSEAAIVVCPKCRTSGDPEEFWTSSYIRLVN